MPVAEPKVYHGNVSRECLMCGAAFTCWMSQVANGGGKFCSYRCMGDAKKGTPSYERTLEHKAKMSELVKERDLSLQRQRFIAINAAKKGKTLEELYGDKAKALREMRRKQIGDKNPNWKGGVDRNKYPYGYYKLRQVVLERDGFRCANCHVTHEHERENDPFKRGLTIHHIDYDKNNNVMSNLITTCKRCNSTANGKREQWKVYYTALLGL